MNKPLAYSYIRMSTEIQLKGDSLRRQEELSEKYAHENELELVKDFKLHDIGVSGFTGENLSEDSALGAFLKSIEHEEIQKGSYLLVESLDRLSRQNVTKALRLLQDITENGINVVTLADNKLYEAYSTDPMQMIYSIIVMSRAHEESQTKSDRVAAAWKNKRDNIETKILTKTCPAWLNVSEDRTEFILIPERVKIVQAIYNDAANGQGSGMITRRLNEKGVAPFGRSNGWIASYVVKILKTSAVLGEFQPHQKVNGKRTPAGPIIENYFPKIIPKDVFYKVQAGRASRDKGAGSGRIGKKHNNLFTHIAKCGYCGSSMQFIDKGKGPKGGKYLKCSASIRGMDCVVKGWKYIDFETSFFHFVREINLREIIEGSNKRLEKTRIRQKISELQSQKETLESRVDRLENLLIDTDMPNDRLKVKYKNSLTEIDEIDAQVSALQERLETTKQIVPINYEDVTDQISSISNFEQESNFEKRFILAKHLKSFVKRINVCTDGIRPQFDKIKSEIEEEIDDLEYANKVIAQLKDTHFNGPRSNPHFTIFFHDDAVRVIIPSPNDPTVFTQKAEITKRITYVESKAGETIFFNPRSPLE